MTELTRFSSKPTATMRRDLARNGFLKLYTQSIEAVLRKLGVDAYDLILPETHLLPFIIDPQEQIEGIVYGRYQVNSGAAFAGRGALIATDKRLLLLDKKPLFVKCDEIAYEGVSGIRYTKAGFAGTVVVHTRLGDINIRTFNSKCAFYLVNAIEAIIFNGRSKEPDEN